MEIIFLIGASQALFFSFLVFNKEEKTHGDFVLGAWLVFMGLHLLDYYAESVGLDIQYPHLMGIGLFLPILHGPFMYLYILVTISKTGKFKPLFLLHGLPFLLFTIYFLDFYLLGAEEKLVNYRMLKIESALAYTMRGIFNVYLGPIYLFLSFALLRRHRKNISMNFSYTDDIDFAWLRHVLIWLSVVWFFVALTNLPGISLFDENFGDNLIYLSLTVAIFFIGYFGIKQQAIYVQSTTQPQNKQIDIAVEETETSDRYKHSGLKKEEAEKYKQNLFTYMEKERPYLNKKLSLNDVADHLNISINHVSQIINENIDKNFFDFVNNYRVEEVKRLINESKHEQMTLLGVAYESGFNSKSSFNSIFKKFTDTTPSEYIKSLKN